MALNEICDMLSSYSGRDKVMRTLCYGMKLASGLTVDKDPVLSKKFQIFSSQMSKTRATLRLLDDIPMLQHSLQYGFGRTEPDGYLSFLGVLTNVVDQLYYPIEKVCWLAEHRLLHVENANKWDTISSIFWVASIYLTLMKSLRSLSLIHSHKKCLLKKGVNPSEIANKLLEVQHLEYLASIRGSLDLIHSVSTLPDGWLWGGKLNAAQVGLVATISSVLGIYQYFLKKKSK
uniref:Putative peroxisomal bioproteinsis protein peroxin n=1 Tax=Xenopsylla cheopis TaxID=163159 RepID=A0A6M2DTX0_XENCH